MPSIKDRLKKLGVKGIEVPVEVKPRLDYPIEKAVDGRLVSNSVGNYFLVERNFPLGHSYGNAKLEIKSPLDMISSWAGESKIAGAEIEDFCFVDTETTGLAGGSGTLAFMVGMGRFEKEEFKLAQFFLKDPGDETAMLLAIEEFLAPCKVLVSFNGKAFDIPLMNARYITNMQPSPFKGLAQLDILHLARRLWRDRLPSRTLNYLETEILEIKRTGEDTPGWMIPSLYNDYLLTGDSRPLAGVFYHNEIDILSLATLTEVLAKIISDPLGSEDAHTLDLLAVGKLNEDLGNRIEAKTIYEFCLEKELPAEIKSRTIKRLSYLYRRLDQMPEALSLWWQAAADREIYAHEELAKYYEHKTRDFVEAKKWTNAALVLIKMPEINRFERIQWQEKLDYRLDRLNRKIK